MKKITFFTIFLFYIVSGVITIRAYAEEQDIFITNPKVPTQVTVTIKGTPNVNVVNTPLQVEVANGDGFEREPFQFTSNLTNQSGNISYASYRVPSDKRLVIETVSMTAAIPIGHEIWAYTIETRLTHELEVNHYIPVFRQAKTTSISYYSACQDVRLYADPGTTVFLRIHLTGSAYSFLFAPTISGYLIPYECPNLAP
jgi:hypothetical protein